MGRYTREQTEANRERVLTEASRLLRERGLDGVGVADLMAAAGLTHGGFYRHFASKDDLAVTAAERLARGQAEQWRGMGAQAREDGRSGLDAILETYLSEGHREAVGGGCVVAALGSDLARLTPEARARASAGMHTMTEALAELLPPGSGGAGDAQERATFVLSAMMGALVLSRLDSTAEGGAAILRAVASQLRVTHPAEE